MGIGKGNTEKNLRKKTKYVLTMIQTVKQKQVDFKCFVK